MMSPSNFSPFLLQLFSVDCMVREHNGGKGRKLTTKLKQFPESPKLNIRGPRV